MRGVSIILMKGYNGKSRLALNHKYQVKLVDALSSDLHTAVSKAKTCQNSWDCMIATPDRLLSKKCKKKNISVLNLKPGELNSIFSQIQNWAVKKSYDALILCAGDIPLLHGDLIDEIKRKLSSGLKENGKSMVVCPSKSNGVSVIAMSPANLWMITACEGTDNLHVIKGLDKETYPYQILKDIRSYLDLDYQADLVSVLTFMEKNPSYRNRSVKRILYEAIEAASIKANN